ncbi:MULTISPECIES: QueT transporter family protein [unclassified Clostridium]|uniref:QueT transporter family protein n=1 Tax=unclassified Clostridium TaxID=2614128 RepID=UPI00189B60F8|nr:MULTISPECIES: QueT transporter family protein [unclassified Clostridium]MCR1950062.1 QueT transporter family protein [Clostridium sp. DSM 100503]
MRENVTKKLVKAALVAAIYAALTIVLAPISYGPIQFRLSEILVLLAFIDPFYIGGLTFGCLLANILGGLGIMDIVFGTLATFLSVSAISLTAKYIKSKNLSLIIGSLWPTIFNGIIVGWMISVVSELPMVITMLQVGIGEFVVVTVVGIPVFKLIENKYKGKIALQ